MKDKNLVAANSFELKHKATPIKQMLSSLQRWSYIKTRIKKLNPC